MKMIYLIMLALHASLVLPAVAHGDEAAPAANASSIESWSAFARNFWTQRAQETILINDQAWSIRVKQTAERLAKAREDIRRPYEHLDAPLYIRLTDGATAHTLAQAVAASTDDARVVEGVIVRVGKKRLAIREDDRGRQYPLNLTDEQMPVYIEHIKNKTRLELVLQKAEQRTYDVLPTERLTPTAEQLRAWCAKRDVEVFPDARPVEEVTVERTRIPVTTSEPNGLRVKRTYTYTWPRHDVLIPPAAR